MPVCVYAIVPASMRWGGKWRGLQGEILKLVPCGDAAAVIGTVDAPLRANKAGLERHDALMRAIASATPAALPARFGWVVRESDQLRHLVKASGISFRDSLRLVSGREQMTLRIRVAPKTGASRVAPRLEPTVGPGTRYLTARMGRVQIPQDPVLRALRRRLAALIRSERVRLNDASHLVTLYHLIARGQSAAYLDSVRAFSKRHPDLELTASGPFPAYAFVPRLNP
jgi:hypothetical protein